MVRFTAIVLLLAASLTGRAEEHWSLRPLSAPVVPLAATNPWVRSPIDAFILEKLAEQGMHPSPPATRLVLLRRVYYNLIGLPPTPAELATFLADDSPSAFARVVDRLLDRPEYGERWARHWLDVAHYAESHGHDQDRMRTNAWPYRDYVIASFNSDKPYARFLQEQIAGDAMFPNDPMATVAMGFLATGPWDESSLRDIREDSVDRQIARYIDRDDIVSTVMNTFSSTTVQCARCHDHKFDPVSQREYYALQAVFAGTEKGNRYFDVDPPTHQRRQALLARQEAIELGTSQIREELLGTEFQRGVSDWQRDLQSQSVLWTVLAPTEAYSIDRTNGSTLSLRSDNTLFSGDKRPDKDTYVVDATTAEAVRAVRLETLREPSIGTGGPGRQDNGNFHLTDFQMYVLAADGVERRVRFTNAIATFDQSGWGALKAIDDDPKSGWGIFPEIGKTHAAVFVPDELIPAGSHLRFVLEQNHGSGHIIKRFNLAIIPGEPPAQLVRLPDGIDRMLIKPDLAKDERFELARFIARGQVKDQIAALPAPSIVFAGARSFIPDAGHKPVPHARPVHLLKRGDIHHPGDRAVPGALSFQKHLPADFGLGPESAEGERRKALALWLSDPRNGLTWRSIVNRVWHYHFGQGLAATPNDFGKMGSPPTHPELLDWLANWFVAQGGSFKELHRLILNSAVYQQSSRDHPEFARRDAGNLYLWRMNRSRMDAESARDTILAVAGKLVRRMGGPSDQNFEVKPGIHVTPEVNYAAFDVDDPEGQRRGIYRFVFRTLPDPFMDALDCPDPSQLTPVRNNSITVTQALALWNDQFTLRQSEHLAERLAREAPGNYEAQIDYAYRMLFSRGAGASEVAKLADFAKEQGMPALCRVLLNSNEFMFIN